MTEHYTRSTVEVREWCPKCRARTMHSVFADKQQGRLGPCLECMKRHDEAPKKVAVTNLQGSLWMEGT